MSPVDEFIDQLRAETNGLSRLPLEAIWRVFVRWHPELATAANKRAELARWLELARATGAFAVPKGRGLFDRSAVPHLPQWVAFQVERTESEPFNHRAHPWHPVMAFVATLPRLVNPADALAINRFLVSTRNPVRVPVKERSYEIFGDEKRLDSVVDGSLSIGITLEALHCYVPDFVPVHRTGNTQLRRVLIVENEAAFDSFCRWNRQHPTWNTVVFGRGIEVYKIVPFLQESWPQDTVLEYFGDFDQAGVTIAFRLAQTLQKCDRRLLPLFAGYRFLAQQEAREDTKGLAPDWRFALCWLDDPEVIASATATFAANRRVAQEAFGWKHLLALGAGAL